jgi:hypothetical protein
MKLYMFRTVPLSIIRSFSLYTQRCYMSYKSTSLGFQEERIRECVIRYHVTAQQLTYTFRIVVDGYKPRA